MHINLPHDKQGKSHKKQAPCVVIGNENEWCEHHCKIPVIDSASGAALVFHKPGLKRAEKQNTYHIAHRVKKADEQKDTLINYIGKVKRADYAVENYPRKDNSRRGFFAVQLDFFHFSRDEIASELLLTAHTFKP